MTFHCLFCVCVFTSQISQEPEPGIPACSRESRHLAAAGGGGPGHLAPARQALRDDLPRPVLPRPGPRAARHQGRLRV